MFAKGQCQCNQLCASSVCNRLTMYRQNKVKFNLRMLCAGENLSPWIVMSCCCCCCYCCCWSCWIEEVETPNLRSRPNFFLLSCSQLSQLEFWHDTHFGLHGLAKLWLQVCQWGNKLLEMAQLRNKPRNGINDRSNDRYRPFISILS